MRRPVTAGPAPPDITAKGTACICDYPVDFYPGNGGGYPGGPGYPGGYGGYNVHFSSPGVRVTGRPVNVPSGAIYIDGPPIYVQAPPVRVASPQVYIQRPNVVVAPSQVTVDAPTVHVEGCAEGSTCELSGQSYPTQGYQGPAEPLPRTRRRARVISAGLPPRAGLRIFPADEGRRTPLRRPFSIRSGAGA